MSFAIVVAADAKLGIGKAGDLPWKLPGDMAYFKTLTKQTSDPSKHNIVIMGRKTWDSIPARFRPLAGRKNIVTSRNRSLVLPEGVRAASSLDEALTQAAVDPASTEQIFVIGGGQIYAGALAHPQCTKIYLTRVHASFACDTFLPAFEETFVLESSSEPQEDRNIRYVFEVHRRATP